MAILPRKIYFGGGGGRAEGAIIGDSNAFTGVPWAQRGGIGCRITQLSLKLAFQTPTAQMGCQDHRAPFPLVSQFTACHPIETKGFVLYSEQEGSHWRALTLEGDLVGVGEFYKHH